MQGEDVGHFIWKWAVLRNPNQIFLILPKTDSMKISRLIIPDFQQFKDFDLDLTYPQGHERAGEPLDKVCFIGGNGTGKSTLLQGLAFFLSTGSLSSSPLWDKSLIKLRFDSQSYYWSPYARIGFNEIIEKNDKAFNLIQNIDKHGFYFRDDNSFVVEEYDSVAFTIEKNYVNKGLRTTIDLNSNNRKNETLIHLPSESSQNTYASFNDLPEVTLNEALDLFNRFPYYHIVSNDTVKDFWRLLIYHLKKRDNDFAVFQNKAENQLKTFKEGKEEFENQNPDILKSLSNFWNKILAKAGLEFDYENAKNPIQLTDNLQAYIRLKNSKEHIGYNQLSTGIRNFIFKLGHIYALYFNRNIESGFLLVDEPENSLFPDFLYGLVDTYVDTAKNTQIFMATHNPIIAAQFQPYERFILKFEEGTGHVKVRRGTTPAGDDPNDILIKDFGIEHILGREGVLKWERYIQLKTLIPLEQDPTKKDSMIEEFMQIGSDYNFAADAVS